MERSLGSCSGLTSIPAALGRLLGKNRHPRVFFALYPATFVGPLLHSFIHSLLKAHRMSSRVIGAVGEGAHSTLAETGLEEAGVLGGVQDLKCWMGGRREM